MTTLSFGPLTFTNDTVLSILERVRTHIETGPNELLSVVTPNIYHLNLATKDPDLEKAFNAADIRVPDGWPIVVALRAFSDYKGGRVAGSDMSLDVLSLAERRSFTVGLLGGSDHVLERAYVNLRRLYPKLKLVEMAGNPILPATPSEESKAVLLDAVNETPVDILMLCLGAPKSETHVEACRQDIDAKVVLCVGATVDFLADAVKRAPQWVQVLGLEWIFRLIQEPSRLWRRYFTSGLQFLAVFFKEACGAIAPVIRNFQSKAKS